MYGVDETNLYVLDNAFQILGLAYDEHQSGHDNVKRVVRGKPGQSELSVRFRQLSKIHHPDNKFDNGDDTYYKVIVAARDAVVKSFKQTSDTEDDYDEEIVTVRYDDEYGTQIFIKTNKPIVLLIQPAYWIIKRGLNTNKEYQNCFSAGHFDSDWYQNMDFSQQMKIYSLYYFHTDLSFEQWCTVADTLSCTKNESVVKTPAHDIHPVKKWIKWSPHCLRVMLRFILDFLMINKSYVKVS